MIKIGFVGVPGSGKSTLARALSSRCREIQGLNNVELVSEYARRYISKHGSVTSIMEQYRILEKQVSWEDSINCENTDIMLTDSPIFLELIYCIDLPKSNSKEIMFFNDIFKKMVELNNPTPRYDIVFHLNPDIKPVDDGVRITEHFDNAWRQKSDMLIRSLMEIFKPKEFYCIQDPLLENRISFCLDKIKDTRE